MAGPTTTRTVLEPSLTFDLTIHSHTSIKSIAFSPISTNSQRFIYLGTSSGSLLLLCTNPNEKIPTKDPKSTLDFDISSRNVSLVNSVSFGDSPLDTVLFLDEIGKDICYPRVPPEEQIKDLLRKKNLKEAISLLEELESNGEMSNEMLSFVHAQVGFLLLFDLHFEEAVNHFLQSETMQPSEVFPFIMRDPNRWSLLVPRNRYWGLHPPPLLLLKMLLMMG